MTSYKLAKSWVQLVSILPSKLLADGALTQVPHANQSKVSVLFWLCGISQILRMVEIFFLFLNLWLTYCHLPQPGPWGPSWGRGRSAEQTLRAHLSIEPRKQSPRGADLCLSCANQVRSRTTDYTLLNGQVVWERKGRATNNGKALNVAKMWRSKWRRWREEAPSWKYSGNHFSHKE